MDDAKVTADNSGNLTITPENVTLKGFELDEIYFKTTMIEG